MSCSPRSPATKPFSRWPAVSRLAERGYIYLNYRLGIPHESDYAFFANLRGAGLFVDVGAGTGQSARSLHIFNRDLRIVAFEPNRLREPELRLTKRLLGAGFEYRLIGLGSRDVARTLYVPVAGSHPLVRWATTDRAFLERCRPTIEAEAGTTIEIEGLPIETRRFDELDLRPAVVKIDVEGCELEVLEGMHQTLVRDEPILMIESGDDAEAVAAWLGRFGYQTFEYDVDQNLLRETGDLCGTRNFFACTTEIVEVLRKSDSLRILLSEPVAQCEH